MRLPQTADSAYGSGINVYDAYDPLNPSTTLPLRKQEIYKGPNHADKSNTTLIIEHVPQGTNPYRRSNADKFNEFAVREWFSQFGDITSVTLDKPNKQIVLVYANHDSALRAWNDPRPIFENRFVKVWWKKSEGMMPERTHSRSAEPEISIEALREQALRAQEGFLERQKRKEELERKKEELERQRRELLAKQALEKEKLLEKIRRAKEKQNGAKQEEHANGNGSTTPATDDEISRKEHLQKMLSELQSQANALNIPPSEYAPSESGSHAPSFRGGYRGSFRGRGFHPRARGASSRSLDLRPKSIQITNVAPGSGQETSVQEHLLMNYSTPVTEHVDGTVVITFKERYEAEDVCHQMMYADE
jgi:hypothetical protein